MGRNVVEEVWVTCRASAQLKFLTPLQRERGFEGPSKALGMLGKHPAWEAAQAQSSADGDAC